MRLTLALMLSSILGAAAMADTDHTVEGAANGRVTVLIYEDLQCPDCADFRQMLDKQLLPRYETSVRFEHIDFPLAKHAWARKAAIAGRFFRRKSNALAVTYRQAAMKDQQRIQPESFNTWLGEFATAHGVAAAEAIAALDDPALAAEVQSDFEDGVARGIAHTPTILVNGHPFVEKFPFEEVAKTIDAELAAAK